MKNIQNFVFGQILTITEEIEYIANSKPYINTVNVKYPFNEKSIDMFVRMRYIIMTFNNNIESLKQ